MWSTCWGRPTLFVVLPLLPDYGKAVVSLADRSVATYNRQGPRCFFERLFDVLAPEDADVLASWLDDPAVTAAAITRALRDEGHETGATTVARHRRGDCRCDR